MVVVIPARGGSKGVPLKNLRPVAGRSLVARAVDAARAAALVTDVLVSTDHAGIAREAVAAGARIVERPDELSGDTASSESAVLHALDTLAANGQPQPTITVLLQCTSPFIDPADLDEAIRRVLVGSADVSFSAVEDHGFLWTRDTAGNVLAVGHEAAHRPRRQDRAPQYRETGAFYAMRTSGLRACRHRFFGTIDILEVPAWTAPEIDTLEDLQAVSELAARRAHAAGSAALLDVDALVTDFDGVHTDDAAYVSQDGTETVRVNRGDGLGVSRLTRAGVPLLILSTEVNPVVSARAAKLGVPVLHGIADKAGALREWMREHRLDPRRVAYLGNDVNDLPALRLVGWPLAVADARPEVLAEARLTLAASGGHGAVREACERVLAGRAAAQAAPSGTPFSHVHPGAAPAPELHTSPVATATA
ncbi:acylneuraminate cytidylyltransferase [Galactobacter valiniphilus]|uniref:N-acylneuraminate cytidylyltransferase n=1 Tax=Galactobacter valiniphilus TaxID=2676122 RepID=A0A399JF80_9MICC|nr:acylneuraminate cytidylyltransferase [Galactobacter valiniphilus]